MFRYRRILIALTTALVAGLVIRLRGKGAHHETKDNIIKESYQAPFSNPNAYLEDPPIIPDTYVIHLAPGYSLEEHCVTINTNITPHIDHISETNRENRITYTAHSVSDSLLTAIRADRLVTLIDYLLSPLPPGASKPAYQATLQGCDAPREEIEPGSYQVLLAPDYAFKSHFAVVGSEIEPLIQNKYNFHTNKWVYSVKPVDRRLLRAIRSDRNVELVVCESRVKRQTEGDLRPKGEL